MSTFSLLTYYTDSFSSFLFQSPQKANSENLLLLVWCRHQKLHKLEELRQIAKWSNIDWQIFEPDAVLNSFTKSLCHSTTCRLKNSHLPEFLIGRIYVPVFNNLEDKRSQSSHLPRSHGLASWLFQSFVDFDSLT